MAENYAERTVEELRDELRDRDLVVSGTKDELIARLEDNDANPNPTGEYRPMTFVGLPEATDFETTINGVLVNFHTDAGQTTYTAKTETEAAALRQMHYLPEA